jgi:hypothetical protein
MDAKLPRKGKAKSRVLCIQTRRILWLKKDQLLVKQLVDLKKLLLESLTKKLADLKSLQLVNGKP